MTNSDYFARKVPAYFDGTISEVEKMELEAYVGSDREFARYFRSKEIEFNHLKNNIPQFKLETSVQSQIESELKEVVDNLFENERTTVFEQISSWVKEKL